LGKFPQLFCLQSRHVGHTYFGTWGLANSIRPFFETHPSLTTQPVWTVLQGVRVIDYTLGQGYNVSVGLVSCERWDK